MFVFQGDKSADVCVFLVTRMLMFVFHGDKSVDVCVSG